mgnify:CR=1 FL=1
MTFIVLGTLTAFFGTIFYFSLRRRLQLRCVASHKTHAVTAKLAAWRLFVRCFDHRSSDACACQATTDEGRTTPLTPFVGRKQAEGQCVPARMRFLTCVTKLGSSMMFNRRHSTTCRASKGNFFVCTTSTDSSFPSSLCGSARKVQVPTPLQAL